MHVDHNLVHAGQHFVGLVNDEVGAFSDDVQVVIGNESGNFNDDVGFWLEASHFEVHPHQHAMQSRRNLVQCLKARLVSRSNG